jgi:hypothetical protein
MELISKLTSRSNQITQTINFRLRHMHNESETEEKHRVPVDQLMMAR